MKLIVQFYLNGRKVDAWHLDTKNLPRNPKVIRVHLTTKTNLEKAS